jgi:hypothetical protein
MYFAARRSIDGERKAVTRLVFSITMTKTVGVGGVGG